MTANKYVTMYLDNYLLPDYGELKEISDPNAAKNYTLDGTLYVDFMNYRRTWQIKWNYLKIDEYDLIRGKYDKQFSDQNMLTFAIIDLGLSTPVFININEKNIKFNGQLVEGFTITLEEQSAVSI